MPIPMRGEPASPFSAMANDGERVTLDDLAGCFTTLCFFGSAGHAAMAAMLAQIAAQGDLFDGEEHQFIGVSIDPDDAPDRVPPPKAGTRVLWDFDQSLSRVYGAVDAEQDGEAVDFQPLTLLIDPGLRVIAVHKIDDPSAHPAALMQFIQTLPKRGQMRAASPQAPALLVPMVFEVDLCRRLIAHFDAEGGQPSGILEDEDGQTVLSIDPSRKQRRDLRLGNEALRKAAQSRIRRRLLPEIKKAFQFDVTRIERSVITRYDAGDFFAPHRDNAAQGTAHRQFAITIPLNAEVCRGGLLRFPEFGNQVYPIPTGCALVHSCALLHEVLPVTQGPRYAFIPIVYGEEANTLREANTAMLAPGVSADRRETP